MAQFYPELAAPFTQLLAELAGRKIAVIGHARPDGDCIGSQVALARALRAKGYDAVCVNPDTVPRRLEFLVADTLFLRLDGMLSQAADYAAVFVDCADGARAGERAKAAFSKPLAMVDHHISNTRYAQYNLLDTGSSATCEILAGLFLDAGLPLDASIAQALYAGMLTDTGQFRFASTSRRTLLLAAELIGAGARPSEVGYHLYERESLGKMMLLQRCLASLRMECGGRVCIGVLPAGIFAETGTSAEDTEGLVDYARSIDGVEIGVLIEEWADGGVKASLRAKSEAYRVDLIAAQFNGGGHAAAAGLNLKHDAHGFYGRLVAAVEKQLSAVDAAKAPQT